MPASNSIHTSKDAVYFSLKRPFAFERRFTRWVHIYAELKSPTSLNCMSFHFSQHVINFNNYSSCILEKIPVSTDFSEIAFKLIGICIRNDREVKPGRVPNDEFRFIMSIKDFTIIFRRVGETLGVKLFMDTYIEAILGSNNTSTIPRVPIGDGTIEIEKKHRSRVVAREIDKAVKQSIVDKRKAFKWLPVVFSSDLVHGAW